MTTASPALTMTSLLPSMLCLHGLCKTYHLFMGTGDSDAANSGCGKSTGEGESNGVEKRRQLLLGSTLEYAVQLTMWQVQALQGEEQDSLWNPDCLYEK